jgi:Fe-S-cluster containining protein
LTVEQTETRYTKISHGERVLRHQQDHIFDRVCQFLDTESRRCTVYDARPTVCRQFPEGRRCGYYDFLSWERERQDDPEFIPEA